MGKKIIINIGRQFGAGGKAVAAELGRKLGIPVYDNELIAKSAEESGLSSHIFAGRDEKKGFFRLGIFGGAETGSLSDAEVFRLQSETIRRIADAGSAVIVGRCADYILRDMDCTFNVFLTAPMAARVERVCARTGMEPEKAPSFIEKQDRKRESYYNGYTLGNWGVAATYDLCLDSSIFGVEGTADMIIEIARKAGILDE